MSIKVEWVDPSPDTTDYVLYRQDTPIDVTNLPAPLATVAGTAREYTDTTSVRNKLYYYVVGARSGVDVGYTPNKPIAYMPYTGPGPAVILRGDWEFGYFGRVPGGEVFSPQEILLLAPMPPGVDSLAVGFCWYKFVYKGSILFIASHPAVKGVSWEILYKAGVVYGNIPSDDWAPYAKATWGIIPQGKILTRYNGGHSFVLRTPTSRANPALTGSTADEATGGEYDKILACIAAVRTYPDTQGYRQVDDFSNTLGGYTFSTDLAGNSAIIRGNQAGSVDLLGTFPVSALANNNYGWRPLLELIL